MRWPAQGVGALALTLASSCLLDVSYEKVAAGAFCGEPGDAAASPSCDGLPDDCGPGRNEHCCTSTPIPCGSFLRDYDGESFAAAEGREAALGDFRLDLYEVTVGRFRAFVTAGHGTQQTPPSEGVGAHPRYLNSGWNPEQHFDALAEDRAALEAALACSDERRTMWTTSAGDNENKPINCVTWYEALLFCAWDGGRLPSEAEWGYAAAGGSEQRVFPWSQPAGELTTELAVFGCPDGMPGCPVGTSIGWVGSKPAGAGRWGQLDLAGNVAEWVLDFVDGGASTYLSPCTDCVRIGDGDRGLRGGAFNTLPDGAQPSALHVARRGAARRDTRSPAIGFRCARDVP